MTDLRGPTSLSRPLVRVIATVLLAGFLPGAKADCWIDNDGFERCNRFSNAARAGIGIGIFVLFLALVLAATYYRRRRNARANLAYMNQAQGHPNSHGNVYAGGAPGFAPQYPPAAYGGGYDASTGFAPPGASPPQYYPPPPGPPPFDAKHY